MKTNYTLLAWLLPLTFLITSCTPEPAPEATGNFEFSALNNDLRAPVEISFTAQDNIADATFDWDFGDGTTSTEKSPKKSL